LKHLIAKIVKIIVIAYVVIASGIFIFQEKIIFHPEELSADYSFEFDNTYKEVFLKTEQESELNGLVFFSNLSESKGTILYFHGNASNIQRWGEYAVDFTSIGYNVVMFDYPGFGKSKGDISEDILYSDSEDIWKWTKSNFPSSNFIIYGRSLGSALALHLAEQHEPTQLILETPFYKLIQNRFSFMVPFGLKYEFLSFEFIQNVNCPITIFHGTNDQTVPISEANKLRRYLDNNDKFIIIEGGGHKNLRKYELYHSELNKALN